MSIDPLLELPILEAIYTIGYGSTLLVLLLVLISLSLLIGVSSSCTCAAVYIQERASLTPGSLRYH